MVRKIVKAAGLTGREDVLEIGPGKGALTFDLASKARRVLAVEIDRGYSRELREKIVENPCKNVDVLCRDFLKMNFKKYCADNDFSNVVVISNLPYYITTPLIEKLLLHKATIHRMILTMQSEVAQRILAPVYSDFYGSLSCFVQYYCLAKRLFKIKPNSFSPVPKVDSCCVELIIRRGQDVFKVKDEALLFTLMRAAFGQRRKTLRGALKKVLPRNFVSSECFDLSLRAENISIEGYIDLANQVFDFSHRR